MKDSNENVNYHVKQVFSEKDLYPSYSKYPLGVDFYRIVDDENEINIREISNIKVS